MPWPQSWWPIPVEQFFQTLPGPILKILPRHHPALIRYIIQHIIKIPLKRAFIFLKVKLNLKYLHCPSAQLVWKVLKITYYATLQFNEQHLQYVESMKYIFLEWLHGCSLCHDLPLRRFNSWFKLLVTKGRKNMQKYYILSAIQKHEISLPYLPPVP